MSLGQIPEPVGFMWEFCRTKTCNEGCGEQARPALACEALPNGFGGLHPVASFQGRFAPHRGASLLFTERVFPS